MCGWPPIRDQSMVYSVFKLLSWDYLQTMSSCAEILILKSEYEVLITGGSTIYVNIVTFVTDSLIVQNDNYACKSKYLP